MERSKRKNKRAEIDTSQPCKQADRFSDSPRDRRAWDRGSDTGHDRRAEKESIRRREWTELGALRLGSLEVAGGSEVEGGGRGDRKSVV